VITRRGFLKTITTAAGLMILDPSALIEQVGTTFYSFPPANPHVLSDMEFGEMFKRIYGDKIADLFSRHTFVYDQFAKDTQDRPKGDGYIFNLKYNS